MEKIIDCSALDLESYDRFLKAKLSPFYEVTDRIVKIKEQQVEFLIRAHEILKAVLDNDKRKFMYEIRQEDVELINDGKKFRAIRKIIN